MSATDIMQFIGIASLLIGSLAVIFGALGLLRLGDV